MSNRHPLYEEIATNFYSKRQGSPKYKLNPRISEGLAGKVEKNEDYIPQSSLISPLEEGVVPNLDEDNSISVNYEMPRSVHIHKSMLLRGVKFGAPALDRADIEATKGRANSSGRSHGGAPLGGGRGNGRGRGGQINYSNDRPNPFAQHLNPGFAPPVNAFGRGAPPPGQFNGYPPPPPRAYFNGPPPQNVYSGGPPPAAQGPPLPRPGYYNGPPPASQSGYGHGGQYSNNHYGR